MKAENYSKREYTKLIQKGERMVAKTKRRLKEGGSRKNGGEFANHTVCTTVRAAKLDEYKLR